MVFIVKCAYCIIFQECVCMLLLLLLLRFFRPIRMRLVRCALCAFYLTTVIFLLKELTGCANADTRCSLVFSEQHTLYERSERPNVKLDLIKNGKSLNEIWTKLTEPHPTCFSTVPIAGPIVPVFGFCISIFFIFFFFFSFDSFRFVSFAWCSGSGCFGSSNQVCARTWSTWTRAHSAHCAYLQIFSFGLTTWNTLFQLFYFALYRCVHRWMILILLGLRCKDLAARVLFSLFLSLSLFRCGFGFLFQVICVCFFLLLFHINSILSHRSITLLLLLLFTREELLLIYSQHKV